MREELLKLAERVEALRGPDREVDKLIAVVNGWCLHPSNRQRDDSEQSDTGYTCLDCGADSWGNTGPTGQKRSASLPAYTASLDAAMALVPEGCDVMMGRPPARRRVNQIWAQVWDARTSETRNESVGCNLAAALCAAALRSLAKDK